VPRYLIIPIQPRGGESAQPCKTFTFFLSPSSDICHQNALHRPVQSALMHYQMTRDRVHHLVLNVMDSVSFSSPSGSDLSNKSLGSPLPSASPDSGTPSILDETGSITPETAQICSQSGPWVLHCANSQDHEATKDSPSRYLQMACPLCYPQKMPAVFTR
jgi:hypothetical protein